ncbi:MAG TPA: hypothetical protein VL201_01210, partial [Patescibacteria group bacterium]|nr:hypothetical protein [Patescibacteria group bacterium]
EEKNIQSINKKMIEKALNEAHSQAKTSEKNKNIYEKNNITIITLAKNVVLTPAEQEDPLKKFPKAALIKNTALVIHTQRYPNNKEVFSQNSPAVSIAYRNERAEWHTNQIIFEGKDDLRGWINKKKQIDSDYIRLPDLYEIKDIYITQINNEPLALLITQTKQKGHYCDGVYAIPLTGQTKSDLRQPFWYVDIKTSANSWRAAEKIVASTFDEKNQRLFLITEKPIFTKKQESSPSQGTGTKEIPEQQLVTIDINLALNPKKK